LQDPKFRVPWGNIVKYLVIYSIVRDQSYDIVDFIAGQIKEAGHDVDLIDCEIVNPYISKFKRDAIILVGVVNQGKYQNNFLKFIDSNRQSIEKLPTLAVSISLSAAFNEGKPAAQVYLDYLISYTNIAPDRCILVADNVALDNDDYLLDFSSQIASFNDLDLGKGKQDYTNWAQLSSEIHAFQNSISEDSNPFDNKSIRGEAPVGTIELQHNDFGVTHTITCEAIRIFHGEAIEIGTSGLFVNSLDRIVLYSSISLPDWLDLNSATGDVTGTMPIAICETYHIQFAILAFGRDGDTAKANVSMECANAVEVPEFPRVQFSTN